MKKLTPAFFQELSKKKYLSYIQSLPDFRREQTQTYAALALTILAISFFGMFAIGPTLSTISELQKKRDDARFVDEQLTTKLTNLQLLQENYNNLSNSLPIVYAAIPQDPQTSKLIGQLKSIAEKSEISLKLIKAESVDLTAEQDLTIFPSYIVVIDAAGTFESLSLFYTEIVNFERLLVLENVTLTRQLDSIEPLRLVIRAKAYYGE